MKSPKKPRRRNATAKKAAALTATPKSLPELLAELPPTASSSPSSSPSSSTSTSTSPSPQGVDTSPPALSEPLDNVEPLFEPALLAAAHANPEFADTTVIGGREGGDTPPELADTTVIGGREGANANRELADTIVIGREGRDTNPEFADTTVIGRERGDASPYEGAASFDIVTRSNEPAAAVAAQAEAPEIITPRAVADEPANDADIATVKTTTEPELTTAHDAETEATELLVARAATTNGAGERASRRGGLLGAVRMAASALGKAKELKHKLDDALAARPIEHRASATDRIDSDEHALAKYNELAHGTNALEAVGHVQALATIARDEHIATHVGPSDTHTRADERDIEIDTHVRANEHAIERDLQLRANASASGNVTAHATGETHDANDEAPHHVLTADGSVYRPAAEAHIDDTVAKGLAHERDALADARDIVDMVDGGHEQAANKKLAAEKAREGDPTVDRRGGASDIDAAYQREVVAKANEIQHELEHHLESEALDREHRPRSADDEHVASENKRARIAEVEPVPTTNDELHRERALFVGAAVWVIGGLAAVVLGILAVAGLARPFVLVEIGVLVAAVSILVSSIANGARLLARHDEEQADNDDDDDARDLDDAVTQGPALHARASDRSVVLHR
jgi:hypothetical protein